MNLVNSFISVIRVHFLTSYAMLTIDLSLVFSKFRAETSIFINLPVYQWHSISSFWTNDCHFYYSGRLNFNRHKDYQWCFISRLLGWKVIGARNRNLATELPCSFESLKLLNIELSSESIPVSQTWKSVGICQWPLQILYHGSVRITIRWFMATLECRI